MAENTLTAIIPDIYEALDVVSRELTGMIPAVTMNASAERAAKNQNINVDIAPAIAGVDITPSLLAVQDRFPVHQRSLDVRLQDVLCLHPN